MAEATNVGQALARFLRRDDVVSHYKYEPDDVTSFLLTRRNLVPRQHDAVRLIGRVLAAHRKEALLTAVAELARVEAAIHQLQPHVRDHVVHAVLSYLLGIWINERFFAQGHQVHPFEWKLAGLLHDIGYPVEIGSSTMGAFSSEINRIEHRLCPRRTPRVLFLVRPVGFERLTRGRSALALLQDRLVEWNVNVDVRHEYRRMMRTGRICHGMLSSVAMLYVIDLMYYRQNPTGAGQNDLIADPRWNQTYFDRHVVSAAAAIFVHNLPKASFGGGKLSRREATLAFLLRLSDSMQDWDRPSGDVPLGFSSSLYQLKISVGQLTLSADIPQERKDRIRREINAVLLSRGIRVQ